MRDTSADVKLLAIDTATTLCGVAVLDLEPGTAGEDFGLGGGQGGVRAAVRRHGVSTHSEMLLPLIAETLGELSLPPRALTGVVCGAGPGSFTGLRIGIATAKGLCFALTVPLVLVSSLHALGEAALGRSGSQRPVLATLNAFRGQVFARLDEVLRELNDLRKIQGNIGNSQWYFDQIPAYVRGKTIYGCTAGQKTLHISPGGMVRPCAELDPVSHFSEYDLANAPEQTCTRCFQACRGEVQAPIDLRRIGEVLGPAIRRAITSSSLPVVRG